MSDFVDGFDGSDAGFNRIHARLRNKVFRFALKKARDRDGAEDLVQEIFLKLHRFRKSYTPGLPFLPWFWTLARNATTDWLRRRRSSRELLLESPGGESEEGASGFDELPSADPGAEERVIRKSLRWQLFRRLRGLTRLQRKVLWLRFVRDLSSAEVAERLGLSLGAVKCLVQRARASLLQELGPAPDWVFA